MKTLRTAPLTALAALAMAITPCHAMLIYLSEVPAGSTIPGWNLPNLGPIPSVMHPSADGVPFVIRQAADYWQQIYNQSTSDVVLIYWGYVDNSASTVGGPNWACSTKIVSFDTANKINVAAIAIDRNKPNDGFYVDPVPKTWSEYPNSPHSTQIAYFGHPGQFLEDERYTDTDLGSGDTRWTDLYTAILHEMGHALGMAGILYNNETSIDHDIDVTAPRPIPNLQWMSTGGHLTYSGQPNSLMSPGGIAGQRKWPSQGDVSCIAQIENWYVGAWGTGGGGPQGDSANRPPH